MAVPQAPAPPQARRGFPWLGCLGAVGAAVGAAILLIGALVAAGVAALGNVDEYDRVDVPGEGRVTIEEEGRHRIFYESSDFSEAVCHEETYTTRVNDRPQTRTRIDCDNDALIAAGTPELRSSGTDESIDLEPARSSVHYEEDGFRGVEAFEFDIDKAGTYELRLDEAPERTERLAVGRVGEAPGWAGVTAVAGVVLGVAALGLGVFAIVRLATRGPRVPTVYVPPPSPSPPPPQPG